MFWHKAPVPNIQRLLAEGEQIIHVARQHPLYGWEWLLAAACCGVGVVVHWAFIIPALACFVIYLLPFYLFEAAVTTHRFIARQGRFTMDMEEILPVHFDHWDINQNLLLHMVHAGHITLHLRYNFTNRTTHLRWLWDPLSLIAALEKLSPPVTTAASEGAPELPATVENQQTSPTAPVKPAPPANKSLTPDKAATP